MLDVCLLGTGGTMPLPNRWLTSLYLRWKGKALLVDCGEGTQIAIHQQHLSCRSIDTILLTHYHADHTAGLPGMLLTMAKAERTEPVTIYGPKGLEDILRGVYLIGRYYPFEIRYHEYTEREETFTLEGLEVTSFAVKHSVPTYGYSFYLPRRPKFDAERAQKQNIPLRFWNRLQKGETVTEDGITYTPDMVLGKERRGIHLVYTTDTRPVPQIADHSLNADLLIAEGMYGDPEKKENALKNKHMMMQEAAAIAAKANAKQLWFTHYSPSLNDPFRYKDEICGIFANTLIAKDGEKTSLVFEED